MPIEVQHRVGPSRRAATQIADSRRLFVRVQRGAAGQFAVIVAAIEPLGQGPQMRQSSAAVAPPGHEFLRARAAGNPSPAQTFAGGFALSREIAEMSIDARFEAAALADLKPAQKREQHPAPAVRDAKVEALPLPDRGRRGNSAAQPMSVPDRPSVRSTLSHSPCERATNRPTAPVSRALSASPIAINASTQDTPAAVWNSETRPTVAGDRSSSSL